MATNDFFNVSKEQSEVKAQIVSKYFDAWSTVMMGTQDREKRFGDKIAYIDLFAGPGRYKDGTKSTPLLVVEKAIADTKLRRRLVTLFNDVDTDNSNTLRTEIEALAEIDTLTYPPQIERFEVGDQIVAQFEKMSLIPTFFFVDPWGYKGLSLRLIDSVLKDWGCDCVFFFNYKRINMGLSNPLVKEHMDSLFGEEEADVLRAQLEELDSGEREASIVEAICQAMLRNGKRYVLPFRFRDDRGARTSHHLIFVSKGYKGYSIMKDVMARESSTKAQGVAGFEYSPASVRQPLLFDYARPLDDLSKLLLSRYSGRALTVRDIIDDHNVGTPYIARNYKEVLTMLEAQGAVAAKPSRHERKKNTMADHVTITFLK